MTHVVGSSKVKVTNSRPQSVEKVTEQKPDLCVFFVGDFFTCVVSAFQFLAFVVERFEKCWLILISSSKDSENKRK